MIYGLVFLALERSRDVVLYSGSALPVSSVHDLIYMIMCLSNLIPIALFQHSMYYLVNYCMYCQIHISCSSMHFLVSIYSST